MSKLESIKPYIIPKEPRTLAEGAYLQTPAQLARYESVQRLHQLHAVLRGLSAVRPESRFHRPRAMALLHRYNGDSRDGGQQERIDPSTPRMACGAAPRSAICSEVCPKQVDPANAVNQNKTESAIDWFLRFLTGGSPMSEKRPLRRPCVGLVGAPALSRLYGARTQRRRRRRLWRHAVCRPGRPMARPGQLRRLFAAS